MQNNDNLNSHFIGLASYLTQGNVKNSRTNTFNKTLKLRTQRSILMQFAQNIIHTKKKYPHYQKQLNELSLKLLELHRQAQNTDTPPKTLAKLIEKYQQLIRLIMIGVADNSSDGTTASLQMPIFNKKNPNADYTKITEKLNKLLQESIDANPNPYTSIGELVVNLIIGIFSFFMTDLENLDEETKNKLNQELTNYTQEQKHTNIILNQTIEILNQLTKPAPKPVPTKSPDAVPKNQSTAYSFLNPLNLQLRPGGGTSSNNEQK